MFKPHEIKQIVQAIACMSGVKVNGDIYISMKNVLDLLATYSELSLKLKVEKEVIQFEWVQPNG